MIISTFKINNFLSQHLVFKKQGGGAGRAAKALPRAFSFERQLTKSHFFEARFL
jgi:hypothetical protein